MEIRRREIPIELRKDIKQEVDQDLIFLPIDNLILNMVEWTEILD